MAAIPAQVSTSTTYWSGIAVTSIGVVILFVDAKETSGLVGVVVVILGTAVVRVSRADRNWKLGVGGLLLAIGIAALAFDTNTSTWTAGAVITVLGAVSMLVHSTSEAVGKVLVIILLAGGVIAAATYGMIKLANQVEKASIANSVSGQDLLVSFGLVREPETSSRIIDVCSNARDRLLRADPPKPRLAGILVENARGRCVVPRRPGPESPQISPANRPGVMATNVLGDLTQTVCDQQEANGKSSSEGRVDTAESESPPGVTGRFPADQLTPTADLVGASGIRLVIVADPMSPDEVAPGKYCGEVTVERNGAPSRTYAIAVTLDDRREWALGYAVAWLFIGASLGVMIRFLNDPVSKLVGPYRRLRSLERWANGNLGIDVKDDARRRLKDIKDALAFFDVSAAEELLQQLENIRALPTVDHAAALQGLSKKYEGTAKDSVEGTELHEGKSAGDMPAMGGAGDAGAGTSGRNGGDNGSAVDDGSEGKYTFVLFRFYWPLALFTLVVGIVAVGVVSRYVDNVAFAGTLRDWTGLLVFGLAAQVTATTLAESLGRLLPSASPSSSTRQASTTPSTPADGRA